jgi:hypothetical protein
MPDRRRNLIASFLLTISLLLVVALSGCGSPPPCTARCAPRGLWESPTYQATRALLLVGDPTLGIRSVNGRQTHAPCVGRDGVCEYYVSPGKHTITAAFRYPVPDGGVLAETKGELLTVAHNFQAGHAYVAFYREHPYPKPDGPVGEVASNARKSDERYYWTLEIVDLDEMTPSVEPEVQAARLYTAWIKGTATLSD